LIRFAIKQRSLLERNGNPAFTGLRGVSSKDTACSERRAKLLNPPAIHAQIRISETRRGTYSDHPLAWAELELQIVNESEDGAFTLSVEIIPGV